MKYLIIILATALLTGCGNHYSENKQGTVTSVKTVGDKYVHNLGEGKTDDVLWSKKQYKIGDILIMTVKVSNKKKVK